MYKIIICKLFQFFQSGKGKPVHQIGVQYEIELPFPPMPGMIINFDDQVKEFAVPDSYNISWTIRTIETSPKEIKEGLFTLYKNIDNSVVELEKIAEDIYTLLKNGWGIHNDTTLPNSLAFWNEYLCKRKD